MNEDFELQFVLGLKSKDFTATQDKVFRGYDRFVDKMDRVNERLHKSFDSTMGNITDKLGGLMDAPQKIVKAYEKAHAKLKKTIKPIEQPVDFVFSNKVLDKMSKKIATTIENVLSKVQMRLSVSMPKRRSSIFESDSLKSAYKDMVQPPDYRGRFEIPRFKKGGPVPNVPGRAKGVDNVLSLLTQGEYVLTADTAKSLNDTGIKLRDKQNKFASTTAMTERASMLDNYSTALEKIDRLLENSPDDPTLVAKRASAVKGLTASYNGLTHAMDKLSDESKLIAMDVFSKQTAGWHKYKKDLDAVAESTRKLHEEEIQRANDQADAAREARKTARAAQFIAAHTAVTSLVGGARNLATQSGGEESVLSVISAVNKANTKLNLNYDQKRKAKESIISSSGSLGIMPGQVAGAYGALADAGVRGKTITELQGITALMADTTDLSVGMVAEASYKITSLGHITTDQLTTMYANASKLNTTEALQGGIAIEDQIALIKSLADDADGYFSSKMDKLSKQQQDNTIENIQAFSAVMTGNFLGTTEEISSMIKSIYAAPGSEEAIKLQGQLGMQGTEIQNMLAGAGGAEKLAGILQSKISNFGTDAGGINAAKNATGLTLKSSKMQEIGMGTLNIAAQAKSATDAAVGAANAQKYLSDANQNSKSTFEKLTIAATQWATRMEIGGVSLIDVLDTVNDMNPALLLSSMYLGRMGAQAVWAAGKFAVLGSARVMGRLGSLLGGGRTGLASVASTATSTAGASAGGAAGGFLGGLAQGIGAFASPHVAIGTAVLTGALGVLMLAAGGSVALAGAENIKAIGMGLGYVATAVGDVAVKGLTVVMDTLKSFLALPTEKMLLAGVGIAGFGIGLATFGASLAVAGPSLLVGMSMLPAIAVSMKLIEKSGLVGSISGSMAGVVGQSMGAISGMLKKSVSSLNGVSETAIKAASKKLSAVGDFMWGMLKVGALGVGLELVTIASSAISFWQGGANLSKSITATDLSASVAMVNTVAADKSLNSINPEALKDSGEKLAAVGDFLWAMFKVTASESGTDIAATIDQGYQFWIGLISGTDRFERIGNGLTQLLSDTMALSGLVNFNVKPTNIQAFEQSKTGLDAVMSFLSNMTKVASEYKNYAVIMDNFSNVTDNGQQGKQNAYQILFGNIINAAKEGWNRMEMDYVLYFSGTTDQQRLGIANSFIGQLTNMTNIAKAYGEYAKTMNTVAPIVASAGLSLAVPLPSIPASASYSTSVSGSVDANDNKTHELLQQMLGYLKQMADERGGTDVNKGKESVGGNAGGGI